MDDSRSNESRELREDRTILKVNRGEGEGQLPEPPKNEPEGNCERAERSNPVLPAQRGRVVVVSSTVGVLVEL